MLNKYRFYIVALLALVIIIFSVKIKTNSSKIKKNKFQIDNISEITKIFLADRNGNTISLNNTDQGWIVNNQFAVRKDAINTLLKTANKIRIKKPTSKAAFDNVVKFMATSGVLVEFYENNNLIMSYTIGSNTPDHLGTYMLLKDGKEPFVVHIPYFNGFLSPRYGIQGNRVNAINWRSTNVFNINAESINQIKYTDCLFGENSYLIKTNPITLINWQNKSVPFNKQRILTLLNSFKNLNCETFKNKKDENKSKNQIAELVVNFDTLRVYKNSDFNEKTNENNFTVNRKYATLNNGPLMVIQDYVFNKVLINITELTK